MTIPCGCCPTPLARCWAPQNPLSCPMSPTIVTDPSLSAVPATVLVANPQGRAINNPPLSQTADGNPAGLSYSGFTTPGGNTTGAQNIVIDYVLPTEAQRVIQARIWNNGGGILTDNDGLATGTIVELFDAANVLLFSGSLTALNGAGPNSTALAGGPFSNVAKYRLRNLLKLGGSSVAPLWRDIRLVQAYHAVATWTCPPAIITADILSVGNLEAGGITFPTPATMTQTNGPHTFTFNSPTAFTGVITSAFPGDFSSLAISNGSVVTVSGNHANAAFSIEFTATDLDDIKLPASGVLCDGTVTWYTTDGFPVDPALLTDCPEA